MTNKQLSSFTCVKCKGERNFYEIPPYIEGLERNLCQVCYWENEAFSNGGLNLVLEYIRGKIAYFRENDTMLSYADTSGVLKDIYDHIKGTIMFDGNNAIKYNTERLGYEILNELASLRGLYYMIQQPITVYDRYGLPHTYRVDAYIERNGRKLVIEFDGGVHNINSNKKGDYRRDCDLEDATP